MLHHIELWVRDIKYSKDTLGWLLERIGYTVKDDWSYGISYEYATHYIVLEQGTDVLDAPFDRLRPGINHLAFQLPNPEIVEEITAEALDNGFTLMFTDKHPFAGGPQHYAAYIEDATGFEIELVAQLMEVA